MTELNLTSSNLDYNRKLALLCSLETVHFVSLEVEEHPFACFNEKKVINDVLAPNYL